MAALLLSASLRTVLLVATAALLATVIGTLFGVLSAISRSLILRALYEAALTLAYSAPVLLVMLLLLLLIGDRPFVFPVVAGFFMWGGIALATDSALRTCRSESYVAAATTFGMTPGQVLRRHLLPNSLPQIRAAALGTLAPLTQVSILLSFLGVGGAEATLGSLIRNGYDLFPQCWWIWLPASLVATTLLAAVTILSDRSMERHSQWNPTR